jgi:diguanylate cyclase (GGDEF)-like protein/PAS domain S-box-containing protein
MTATSGALSVPRHAPGAQGIAYRRRILAAAALGIGLLAVLAALEAWGHITLWNRANVVLGYAAALTLAATGWRAATGREREVRRVLAGAFAVLLGAELLRDVEVLVGSPPMIDPAPATLLLLTAVALLGFRAALADGRLRGTDALASYLDAGTIFFTIIAAALLALGKDAMRSPDGTLVLAYATFFLATAGAALMLALAVLAERRPRGTLAIIGCLLLLGISFAGRLAAGVSAGDRFDIDINALLSIAAVVGGWGAATWSARRDEDAAYARVARRLQSVLPLGAAALTPVLLLINGIQLGGPDGDPLAPIVAVAIGLVLGTVLLRQSLLLRDRERAVLRERLLGDELGRAEETYRSMVELVPAVIYLAALGPHGRWHYISPRIEWLLGFTPEEWTADPDLWLRQIHADDRERILAEESAESQDLGLVSITEYRLLRRDGQEVWVRDEAVVIADETGEPAFWRGVIVDITARRRAEDAQRQSEAQTRLIIDTASQAYIGMGSDGFVTEWNKQAEITFGWRRAEVLGRELSGLIIPDTQREAHHAGMRRYLATGEATMLGKRVEVNALDKTGREFPVELTIWAVHAATGTQFSALVHDITIRKQLETQLQHQAFHDSLTNLANRALFTDRLGHALTRQGRHPLSTLAVLFLDLDDFKTINDSLGHAAGDQLLLAVAERMRGALRPEDTSARLGGDEFAVLLEETGREGAREAAERLQDALRSPFDVQGRQVVMRGSIGISTSHAEGTTPDDLLRHADLAMYTAKARGKGRIEFFEPRMHQAVVRRLELKADLEEAIAAGQFELHYQPIVDLRGGRLVGLEALVRWRHPERGLVAPAEFIPAAEESGLIIPLGRFVLETACRQMTAWDAAGLATERLGLSVNVSTHQLEDPGFPETLHAVLAESRFEAPRLTLEITESALMDDIDASAATLQHLKTLGLRLAIDDFGTGYSSLSYLERLPIDVLKIDRSFIAALRHGSEVPVLVRSIIKLGQTLRMDVLAEGIEREEQLVRLRELGCRLGQGFYFSPPVPASGAEAVLSQRWAIAITR